MFNVLEEKTFEKELYFQKMALFELKYIGKIDSIASSNGSFELFSINSSKKSSLLNLLFEFINDFNSLGSAKGGIIS